MSVQASFGGSGRRLIAPVVATLVVGFALLLAPPAARADSTLVIDTAEDRSISAAESCAKRNGCSLREALELVKSGYTVEGAVTIEIGVSGTLELSEGELRVETGPNVDSVAIVGPGQEDIKIDAQAGSRVFSVNGNASFSELTIEGGRVQSGEGGGGGIEIEGGSVSLSHVRLTENTVTGDRNGGAIALEGGSLLIADSLVDQNGAEESGGGLFAEAETVTIERSVFTDNSSEEGVGGAIAAFGGQLEIEDSHLTDNKAEDGGALGLKTGVEATVSLSLLEENEASKNGGAIDSDADSLRVESSEITGNKADKSGAAVYLTGDGTIEASTVNGNTVPEDEGREVEPGGTLTSESGGQLVVDTSTVAENHGVGVFGNDVTVRGSTIVANHAWMGGGGIKGFNQAVSSSVIYGNTSAGGLEDNCAGSVQSGGNNFLGVTWCSWPSGSENVLNAQVEPLLGPLQYNGGPTKTMAPVDRESPLINNGSTPRASDQRQQPRPIPNLPADTDIGAVEVQAPTLDAAPVLETPEGVRPEAFLRCSKSDGKSDTVEDPAVYLTWKVGSETVDGEGAENEWFEIENQYAGKPISCVETIDNGAVSVSESSSSVELAPAQATPSATLLEFGPALVDGGPTAPQQLTLIDSGGADLEVTKVSSDAAEFIIDSEGCETPRVLPDEACAVEVRFDPTAEGNAVGHIVFETTAGTVSVEVTGTGVKPRLELFPTELEFGAAEVDSAPTAPLSVRATNTGTAPLQIGSVFVTGSLAFEISQNGCSGKNLAPGEHCDVVVTFLAFELGAMNGQLEFEGDIPGQVGLKGTGIAPAFAASPASWDFGLQPNGTTSAGKQLTISNPGTAPLQIGELVLGGSDPGAFTLGPDQCSQQAISPGDQCTVTVAFAPSARGGAAAALEFPTNAPNSPQSVTLTGTGGAPAFSADPSNLEFGGVDVGTSAGPLAVTVTNSGNEAMTIGQLSLEGPGVAAFHIAAGESCSGAVLAPGGVCEVGVEFEPAETEPYAAVLSVPGTAPGSVPISGTGLEPRFSAAPSSQDFGPVRLGEASEAEEFTVTNIGDAPLSFGTVDLGGEAPGSFEITNGNCQNRALVPDESCAVHVAFVPESLGTKQATVRFGGSSGQIALSGTGVASQLEIGPTSVDFGEQQIGTAGAPRAFEVKNTGTATATIAFAGLAGAGAAEFEASSGGDCGGATLVPGGECLVEVAFAPSLAGPATAELVVSDGSHSVAAALIGTGSAPLPVEPAPAPPPAPSRPAQPGPAAAPPTPELRVPAGPLTVGDSGRVAIGVSCDSPAGSACPVSITLLRSGPAAARASRVSTLPKRLGRWRGSIAAGASRTVKVRLSKGARATLVAKGRLAATLVVTSGATEIRQALVLRTPPAP